MISLHIIPTSLSDVPFAEATLQQLVPTLELLIAESDQGARRFLKRYWVDKQNLLPLRIVNEHTRESDLEGLVVELMALTGEVGLISDGGTPGVADPGSDLVWMCHQKGMKVVSWPGPSSLTMALAASGFNGQQFTFLGYLPAAEQELKPALDKVMHNVIATGYTHLWIEAPYRSAATWEIVARALAKHPQMKKLGLSVSSNLMLPDQQSRSWSGPQLTNELITQEAKRLKKAPAVFVLGRLPHAV